MAYPYYVPTTASCSGSKVDIKVAEYQSLRDMIKANATALIPRFGEDVSTSDQFETMTTWKKSRTKGRIFTSDKTRCRAALIYWEGRQRNTAATSKWASNVQAAMESLLETLGEALHAVEADVLSHRGREVEEKEYQYGYVDAELVRRQRPLA